MTYLYPDEKKGFFILITLMWLTAIFLLFSHTMAPHFDVLVIIWGLFGFFRLLYLIANPDHSFSNIISLPARILFGLGQAQKYVRYSINARLSALDLVFWVLGGALFVGWLLYCSFYPAELSAVQLLHLKQSAFIDVSSMNKVDSHHLLNGLSFYSVMMVVVLLSLSYVRSFQSVLWGFVLILPIFLLSVIWLCFFSAMVEVSLWPGFDYIKGGGVGQADLLMLLVPDILSQSGTGFLKRVTAGGIVAGYGLYIIFIPVFLKLSYAFFDNTRTFFEPAIGILLLMMLLAIDLFWISSVATQAASFLGLSILVMCWGHVGYENENLTKEQK